MRFRRLPYSARPGGMHWSSATTTATVKGGPWSRPPHSAVSPTTRSSSDLDAIPAVAVLGATWGYALVLGDHDGYREGWAMVEAAALSGVTDYALKFRSGCDSGGCRTRRDLGVCTGPRRPRRLP